MMSIEPDITRKEKELDRRADLRCKCPAQPVLCGGWSTKVRNSHFLRSTPSRFIVGSSDSLFTRVAHDNYQVILRAP